MKQASSVPRFAVSVLVALALLATFGEFFSAHPADEQDLDRSFMPPVRVHFVDTAGKFHFRPFVYQYKLVDPLDVVFREDTSQAFPIRFFGSGHKYSLLGIIPVTAHLATAGGAPLLPLGADELGRDVWARTLSGARTSLLVVVTGLAVCLAAGVLIGSIAGAGAAWLDSLLMRFTEFVLALPALYVILAIRAALPARLATWKALILTAVVIASVCWPPMARGIRGMVLQLRGSLFMEAARGVGCSGVRLWWTHVLPALVPFAAAQLVVAAPAFLLGEVVLSFLDVGLNDSAPSWGAMLRNLLNLRVLTEFSWNTAPLAFVFVTLLSLNLLGRGLAQERRGSRDRREPPGVV